MSRRSIRLLFNGYYDSNGKPTISYKETRIRSTKTRKRRPVRTHWPEVPFEEPPVTFESSNDETQREHPHLQLCWLVLMLPLLYGCSFLSAVNFEQNNFMWTPTVPTMIEMTQVVSTPGNEYPEELTEDMLTEDMLNEDIQEELMEVEKQMDCILPPADQLPNFALESLGAIIIHRMTSDTYPTAKIHTLMKCTRSFISARYPKTVIEGKSSWIPGQCWPFAGSQGYLSIGLPYNVSISHVSLGHIPKVISPTGTISSAPKVFSVYGFKDLKEGGNLLGTFLYDEEGDQIQTFKLPDGEKVVFSYVTLQVKSNWGNPKYTCLYGFRVHGKLAE